MADESEGPAAAAVEGAEAKAAGKPAKRARRTRKLKEAEGEPEGDVATSKKAKRTRRTRKAAPTEAAGPAEAPVVQSTPPSAVAEPAPVRAPVAVRSEATPAAAPAITYGRPPRREGSETMPVAESRLQVAPAAAPVSPAPQAPPSRPESNGALSEVRAPSAQADRAPAERRDDDHGPDGRRRRRRGRRGRGRDRMERSDRPDRPERVDRSDQAERVERVERPERHAESGEEEGVPDAIRSLREMLAEQWTEEKARRFLSEGFLTHLTAGLSAGDRDELPDRAALERPLRAIRRVLADECMVQDDATDVMLLDLVVNALADWTQVYRLRPESARAEELERIIDLRYKADRRLIESIAALKNS